MKRFLIAFILLLDFSANSQFVLDAPFVYSKEHAYGSYPDNLAVSWRSIDNGEFIDGYEAYFDFYPKSFLYSEQEYGRVRCFKFLDLKNAPLLSKDFPKTSYKLTSDKNQYLSKDSLVINKEDLALLIPKRLREANNQKFFDYEYPTATIVQKELSGNAKQLLQNFSKINNSTINSEGKFKIDKNLTPNKIEHISFKELIYKALVYDDELTAYPSEKYDRILTKEEVKAALPLKGKEITGLRIMEDYFVNPLTNQMSSFIIGIGLVTSSPDKGNEAMWFYFPEMMWTFNGKGSMEGGKFKGYYNLIEDHKYPDKFENYDLLGSGRNESHGLIDNQLCLYALPLFCLEQKLTKEFIIEGEKSEEVYNGKIKVSNSDGSILFKGNMSNGICEGKFKFYYPNGKQKGSLNYTNNQLVGSQKLYYENGKVYTEFSIENNDISVLKRFYKDGRLMEEGSFKNGFQIDEWNYFIQCDKKRAEKIILDNPKAQDHYSNGVFTYKVNYTQKKSEECRRELCVESELIK